MRRLLHRARAEIALANAEAAAGRVDDASRRMSELRGEVADDQLGVDPALAALIDAATPQNGTVVSAQSVRPRAIDLRPHGAQSALIEPLTRQEQAIPGQLASHRSYPEIGRELYISRHTVKTHVSRIYRSWASTVGQRPSKSPPRTGSLSSDRRRGSSLSESQCA